MNEHVIDFSPQGTVHAMQSDKFDLGFLGRQQIKRASEIVWLEDKQQWQILVEHENPGVFDSPLCSALFAGYEAARKFEVEALNACRLAQVQPASLAGQKLIAELQA